MILINKIDKEECCQCTSCQCDNKEIDTYKIKIGKTERQTVTIKLCYKCLCEFIGKAKLVNMGILKED